MNTRAFTLALVIAAFSMFMVHTYIDDYKSGYIKKYGNTKKVVIAAKDIQELELIDDSKLIVKNIPANYVSPGFFSKKEDVMNTVATVAIKKNEQITNTRISHPGAETGLSRQVSAGKRAFSMRISEERMTSQLIRPGDRVDIIIGIDYAAGRQDMRKVMTVLQDVLVLATGKSVTGSLPLHGVKTPKVIKVMKVPTYTDYQTVSLELDPYQVQKMVYILNFTSNMPYLSLRNNNDKKRMPIRPSGLYDVLGDESEQAKRYFQQKYKR